MIVKERRRSLMLRQLEALNRRIPPDHHKAQMIKEDLLKHIAGYNGEKSIEYPLSFLQEQNYYIFHDIRLQVEKHFFQLDTLVLSSNFIVILEVKNFKGTLYFDHHFHQLIRTYEGKEEAYSDPLIQIDRQSSLMKKWLSANKLPEIPIITAVVISNPKTIIKSSSNNLNQRILHLNYLPKKLAQLEQTYTSNQLTVKEMKKIIRQILAQDTPLHTAILKKYNIDESELLKGVICPSCFHLPLKRERGEWKCSQCNRTTKHEHIHALLDYALLITSTISNKELRDFLQISSSSLATKILRSMNLTYFGANKNRVYSLPFERIEIL